MSEGDMLDPYADALLAARFCALDPIGLGGLVLRGGGEARDAVIAELRAGLPDGAPLRRVPPHVDDEALLGGLDLGATLGLGRPVARTGLLVAADGGVVVVPMAERFPDGAAARIAAVMDAGEVEGVPAGFALVLLDDGIETDERAPATLLERCAFWIDLRRASSHLPASSFPGEGRGPVAERLEEGIALRNHDQRNWAPAFAGEGPVLKQAEIDQVRVAGDHLAALATTAFALGIDSARAPLFALRAARASAALAGRDTIDDDDILLAARLVLAPRATRMPAADAPPEDNPEPPPPETEGDGDEERGDPGQLDDIVLAATLAALPKDVLAMIASGARRGPSAKSRGAGERRKSPTRGRPLGARAGVPRGGLRLSLIDTLRAAAPWQKLRDRGEDGRIRIRRDDLRIRRFESRAETLTIFAVDASGSSAVARLAEAKGAVELLLAEAYVKRAQVALVAFRGAGAELLLPPTRSLARARRSLADLPGGGGTPLAAGLNAARELAEVAKARGRTPFVVVLTDGRANIAADGSMVQARAQGDAEVSARAFAQAGIGAAFVDISPRPRPEGARLAAAMGARYLPLPRADAAAMHAAVSAVKPA